MEVVSLLISFSIFLVTIDAYMSAFYADNGLQQSWPTGRMSRKTRRGMRHEILNLLGLHHRPKPPREKKDLSGPQFLLDVYKSMEPEEGRLYSHKHLMENFNTTRSTIDNIQDADMIMSFDNKISTVSSAFFDRERKYYFDVSKVPLGENMISAELRIYKSRSVNDRGPFRFYVYKMEQGQDVEDRHLRLLETRTVNNDFHGWLEINITETAQLWTVFPGENLGLITAIYDRFGRELSPGNVGIVGETGPRHQQPFMLAFFKVTNEVHSRTRRSTKNWRKAADSSPADMFYADRPQWTWGRMAYNKNDHQVCQQRLLYVNFQDLNWQDWIIAPEGYWAYFCYGECSFPLNSHMNATNHAIIQTLVHSMKPLLVPKPCCAPTKLSAISVLYFDNNSDVILKKYRNMVVKSCGCL